MPYTILIAGGTGLVGSRLAPMLRERGHTVILLSRRADEARGVFGWEPENGTIDDTAVRRADIIINLSGSGIADGRWTTKRRKSIIDSRVKGASYPGCHPAHGS